jgi:DNA polymerase
VPLDERRLAMLREIGVPFWQPLASRSEPSAETRSEPLAEPRPEARTEVRHPAPRSPAATPSLSAPIPAPIPPPMPAPLLHQAGEPSVGSPGGADVTTLDWPALQEAVASCRACALCDSRTHTVFGVGHRRAHWMVVGEAPGEQEDLKGEPFVGPAGRLLDNMLHAIGVTRAESAPEGEPALTPERQAYIANTLKCRPPRNRNPEPQEMARCEPFLVRQIELVRPRVILAMGRFAVQALLRTTEPIGRLRGRVHRYQGVPLIVTYHPAYLLRNLPDKAKAWDDLCLAVQTMRAADKAAAT